MAAEEHAMPSAYCPECHALMQFTEQAAGKRGRCLQCKQTVVFQAVDPTWGPAASQDKPRVTVWQVVSIMWFSLGTFITFVSVMGAGNGNNMWASFVTAGCFLLFGYLSAICDRLSAICENGRAKDRHASRTD